VPSLTEAEPVAIATRPVRVLLVEDDEGDAVLVEALLEDVAAPVELSRARSLQEAEKLLPLADCVLLDLGLPDTTGLEGLRRLLRLSSPAAIIVLTGLTDEQQGTGGRRGRAGLPGQGPGRR
jgi:DNA-binding response OmpR family regulator